MKGIISLIEVGIAGVILMMAFLHFFPKYSIRSNWDRVLLLTKVEDTLKVIDNMNKTYEFATDSDKFNDFMGNVFSPEETGVIIWWKEINGLEIEKQPIPHFTQAQKATIVDVVDVFFEDNFETDTTGDYTWTTVDTNSPINSHKWNSTEKWIEITTGDNDKEDLSKNIHLSSSGYAKIKMIKRKDYPTDNAQALYLREDENNYYYFRWEGSGYTTQGVRKIIDGNIVDSYNTTGTVNNNDQEYIIEMWWSPVSLRLDIDGETIKDMSTSDTTELIPTSFYLANSQIDLDLESIEFTGFQVYSFTLGLGYPY